MVRVWLGQMDEISRKCIAGTSTFLCGASQYLGHCSAFLVLWLKCSEAACCCSCCPAASSVTCCAVLWCDLCCRRG